MRVVNDSLNGCQSPSVTEPQRDKVSRDATDEVAPYGFRINLNPAVILEGGIADRRI